MEVELSQLALIASALFVVGYVVVSIAHQLGIDKAAIVMMLGGALWILIALFDKGTEYEKTLEHVVGETAEIILFLLTAMALVEILAHYGFFDVIREYLDRYTQNSYKKQFWAICAVAFLLSPIINSLTATLVAVAIAYGFFRGHNLVVTAAAIVIAANAGGAFSPLGDITTIMLWLAGKFTAYEIVFYAFLPSLTLALVSTWMLSRQLEVQSAVQNTSNRSSLSASEKLIIGATFASFSLPFVFSQLGLLPFLGLMTGFAIVWLGTDILKKNGEGRETHLTASIEKMLSKLEWTSLLFFVGILTAVGALTHLEVLQFVSANLFGEHPDDMRLIGGSIAVGFISAILDNIPMAAASLEILNTTDPAIWSLMALTLGVGGSILVIGSAAGVVAMSKVPELTFTRYIRVATLPALVGYIVAIAVWVVQYKLIALLL